MVRRGQSRGVGRVQKYWNLSTFQVAQNTTVFVPAGGRLISVRGANSDADTYSFKIDVSTIGTTAFGNQSITYTNIANGQRVSVKGDFPFISNKPVAAAGAGDLSLSVTAGQFDSLEVYYSTGSPLIDLPSPVESLATECEHIEVPPAVKEWLKKHPLK